MNKPRSLKNKKILITCGPTWTPIDKVRVISNCSTGELGLRLANALSDAGAEVTVLKGPILFPETSRNFKIVPFTYYDEFSALIKREIKKSYHLVIHAAAVSDFRVKKPFRSKLKSGNSPVKLTLEPTEKIIEKIKRINPEIVLVGFKLETNIRKEELIAKARTLIKKAKCNVVVANHFPKGKYRGYIIGPSGRVLSAATSRQGMARSLVKELSKLST